MRSPGWERTQRLTRGVWIAGIGLMLLRNRIWPDALFLVGAVRLVEAYRHPERRRSFRAGVILVALGLLIGSRVTLAEILVLALVGLLMTRVMAGPERPKPAVDMRLE